jgi:hypothetical protein
MRAPDSTIPAFVILPLNFPGDATSQLVSGASTTDTDTLPIHANDLKLPSGKMPCMLSVKRNFVSINHSF